MSVSVCMQVCTPKHTHTQVKRSSLTTFGCSNSTRRGIGGARGEDVTVYNTGLCKSSYRTQKVTLCVCVWAREICSTWTLV